MEVGVRRRVRVFRRDAHVDDIGCVFVGSAEGADDKDAQEVEARFPGADKDSFREGCGEDGVFFADALHAGAGEGGGIWVDVSSGCRLAESKRNGAK